ncbi:hypothetical protein [Flavobacterium sp.]|jgi:hypothetical protein|uniref:hypothetical protein n=1 Tax=Flavobacterium sp. TaxID=239 RepID=UPI0037BF9252
MSKITIYIGSLFIAVNTIIGLLISNYLPFNWLSVDAILIINTILLSSLSSEKISDGYKISLSFIYLFLSLVSIFLAVLSPDKFKDNYYVIGFIFILFIEVSLFLIAKKLNKYKL